MTNLEKVIALIFASFLIMLAVVAGVAVLHPTQAPKQYGDVSLSLYNSATNSTVTCPNGTSSVVVVGSSGRIYFGMVASSTAPLTLCKAATCVAGSGVILSGSGGSYEQKINTDSYIGQYSCIGNGATSTAGYVSNQ